MHILYLPTDVYVQLVACLKYNIIGYIIYVYVYVYKYMYIITKQKQPVAVKKGAAK